MANSAYFLVYISFYGIRPRKLLVELPKVRKLEKMDNFWREK